MHQYGISGLIPLSDIFTHAADDITKDWPTLHYKQM